MTRLLIFIFSILSLPVFAQVDSLKTNAITFEVAIDYGKLITLPSSFETKLEAAFDIKYKLKYELLVEVGYASLTPTDAIKNGTYTSTGPYFRTGLLYGGEILPKSFMSIGAMYGSSTFKDEGTIVIESTIWEDFDEDFAREDLKGTWFEILLVTEQHLRNNLSLGAKLRWRKLLDYTSEGQPDPISIPGYGQTINNSIPAANLYIKYRF